MRVLPDSGSTRHSFAHRARRPVRSVGTARAAAENPTERTDRYGFKREEEDNLRETRA